MQSDRPKDNVYTIATESDSLTCMGMQRGGGRRHSEGHPVGEDVSCS